MLRLNSVVMKATVPLKIETAELLSDSERSEYADSSGDPSSFADPLEQVADLLRDLEEACVLGNAQEVLKSVPKAKSGTAPSFESSNLSRSTFGSIKRLFASHTWQRAVSWPEIVFAVIFSLFIAVLSWAMTL